jgi:putative salt-induced outer membrane protein YdiY
MNSILSLLLIVNLNQAVEPSATPTQTEQTDFTRAADAAERAATAAQSAAERAATAAQSAAEAANRVAQTVDKLAQAAPAASEEKPPEDSEAAAKAEAAKETSWTGTISAGLISLTGNSRSTTTTGAASATRQSKGWLLSAKANGAYGVSRPAEESDEPEVVALNAALELRGGRRFTERYSGYLLAGGSTDHVKSIESLQYGEAGVSILWLERKEDDFVDLWLQTDLAFRAGEELRYQYYPTPMDIPNVPLAAPKLGLAFRYALDRNVIFTEDFEILPTVLGPSRLLVNSTTKLNAKLVSSLSLGVSFLVKHDSRPAEGKLPTDTALNVGLEVAF